MLTLTPDQHITLTWPRTSMGIQVYHQLGLLLVLGLELVLGCPYHSSLRVLVGCPYRNRQEELYTQPKTKHLSQSRLFIFTYNYRHNKYSRIKRDVQSVHFHVRSQQQTWKYCDWGASRPCFSSSSSVDNLLQVNFSPTQHIRVRFPHYFLVSLWPSPFPRVFSFDLSYSCR